MHVFALLGSSVSDAPLPGDIGSTLVTIPVAPPPTLINPDKPVAMASAPTHVNPTSALTKQKLRQTIQLKEQQKLLEQAISQQLSGSMTNSELLAQALKHISPVRHCFVYMYLQLHYVYFVCIIVVLLLL